VQLLCQPTALKKHVSRLAVTARHVHRRSLAAGRSRISRTASTISRRILAKTPEAHRRSYCEVVTNNHNLGNAVVNAFELKMFLAGKPIDPPRQLVERYPELASVMSLSQSGE